MREVRCNSFELFQRGEINGEEGCALTAEAGASSRGVVEMFITKASELGRGIDTTGY